MMKYSKVILIPGVFLFALGILFIFTRGTTGILFLFLLVTLGFVKTLLRNKSG